MSWKEVQAARLRELGYSSETIESLLKAFPEIDDVPDEELNVRRFEQRAVKTETGELVPVAQEIE